MTSILSAPKIWKQVKRSKHQPESPDKGAFVSYAEANRFDSDINLRQYFKTEAPERYAALNDVSRTRAETDFKLFFGRF